MSRRKRQLDLSEAERITLEQARDHHPLAYIRERAAALLRIASGRSAFSVARCGILKPREPDTVYAWLNSYELGGIAALYQKPRRRGGFSP